MGQKELGTPGFILRTGMMQENIALRGTTETLYKPNNGNFLKEVELMAQFDLILRQHFAKVEGGAKHTSYLGKNIQNKLIDCICVKIVECMVDEIKQSKYFSIILDCTPDLNHREQLSVDIRVVSVEDTPQLKEHFMGRRDHRESLSILI